MILFSILTEFNDFEKTCCSILSFKNEVPLAIADDEIALAKALKKPLAILLSKIIFNFSLPIFCGLSFFIVLQEHIKRIRRRHLKLKVFIRFA